MREKMERSSYPDTVKGGSGRLAAGDVGRFAGRIQLCHLERHAQAGHRQGQVSKMDRAPASCSAFSYQSCPSASLDFTDVFSGFPVRNINGNAQVKNGVLDTQDAPHRRFIRQ